MPRTPRFFTLDIESTGIHPPRDKVVEIAIVNDSGDTVLNTLVNPEVTIGNAKEFHGITNAMVQVAPTLRELWPTIEAIVSDAHVIIYNANFDTRFFPQRLNAAGQISCCMQRFAATYGDWDEFHGSFRWKKLTVAADYIGYRWVGTPHRALADALACSAIWCWLDDKVAFGEHVPPKELIPSEVPF